MILVDVRLLNIVNRLKDKKGIFLTIVASSVSVREPCVLAAFNELGISVMTGLGMP